MVSGERFTSLTVWGCVWLSQSRSSAHKSAGEWMELVDLALLNTLPCAGVFCGVRCRGARRNRFHGYTQERKLLTQRRNGQGLGEH